MYQFSSNNSSIHKELGKFRTRLVAGGLFTPPDVSKFVFVCGANKAPSVASERRLALLDFASRNLPHSQFFLAEPIFELLFKDGHKENLLDIEHEISSFADYVLIVLESNSSFCELGAFSHKGLREKLIVINDDKYEKSPSFINLGPLKAIREAAQEHQIFHYPMRPDGVHTKDAIGSVYKDLYKILSKTTASRASALQITACNPAKHFNKTAVRFVHDLVYFSAPVIRAELIEILKIVFGPGDYKLLSRHLAMLVALKIVAISNTGHYRSQLGSPYFRYPAGHENLMAAFRNWYLRKDPERIYAT